MPFKHLENNTAGVQITPLIQSPVFQTSNLLPVCLQERRPLLYNLCSTFLITAPSWPAMCTSPAHSPKSNYDARLAQENISKPKFMPHVHGLACHVDWRLSAPRLFFNLWKSKKKTSYKTYFLFWHQWLYNVIPLVRPKTTECFHGGDKLRMCDLAVNVHDEFYVQTEIIHRVFWSKKTRHVEKSSWKLNSFIFGFSLKRNKKAYRAFWN